MPFRDGGVPGASDGRSVVPVPLDVSCDCIKELGCHTVSKKNGPDSGSPNTSWDGKVEMDLLPKVRLFRCIEELIPVQPIQLLLSSLDRRLETHSTIPIPEVALDIAGQQRARER